MVLQFCLTTNLVLIKRMFSSASLSSELILKTRSYSQKLLSLIMTSESLLEWYPNTHLVKPDRFYFWQLVAKELQSSILSSAALHKRNITNTYTSLHLSYGLNWVCALRLFLMSYDLMPWLNTSKSMLLNNAANC